ncbi:MAG TPA: hypothetical protein VFB14_27380 [Bryobacteraceae bacterium]|nr:hypothetical protein [Bryobacteraceae bacterium]
MSSRPPRIAEVTVALLLPPACREEVLGDLQERCKSPMQYVADALSTVPFVVISRIRRTADPQVLLIQASVLYLSFIAAAWLRDPTLLGQRRGLLRLAIPVVMAIAGLILDDAYAKPGPRPAITPARGPLLGLLVALVSQEALWMKKPDWALPHWVAIYGCVIGLLLSSGIRMLFPPISSQLLGIKVPVAWLQQAGASSESLSRLNRILKPVAGVVALAAAVAWAAENSISPRHLVLILLAVLLIAGEVSRRV